MIDKYIPFTGDYPVMEPSGFILTNHANHGRVIFFIHFHPVVMMVMMIVIVNSGIMVVLIISRIMMMSSSVTQTGWR